MFSGIPSKKPNFTILRETTFRDFMAAAVKLNIVPQLFSANVTGREIGVAGYTAPDGQPHDVWRFSATSPLNKTIIRWSIIGPGGPIKNLPSREREVNEQFHSFVSLADVFEFIDRELTEVKPTSNKITNRPLDPLFNDEEKAAMTRARRLLTAAYELTVHVSPPLLFENGLDSYWLVRVGIPPQPQGQGRVAADEYNKQVHLLAHALNESPSAFSAPYKKLGGLRTMAVTSDESVGPDPKKSKIIGLKLWGEIKHKLDNYFNGSVVDDQSLHFPSEHIASARCALTSFIDDSDQLPGWIAPQNLKFVKLQVLNIVRKHRQTVSDICQREGLANASRKIDGTVVGNELRYQTCLLVDPAGKLVVSSTPSSVVGRPLMVTCADSVIDEDRWKTLSLNDDSQEIVDELWVNSRPLVSSWLRKLAHRNASALMRQRAAAQINDIF